MSEPSPEPSSNPPATRRTATVMLDGARVGTLEELTAGGSRFRYDAAWLALDGAVPVSLRLPLRAEPYESTSVHPFFLNLLPEGWLLEVSLSSLKLSKDDVFGLICALCADCIGAVEIRPDD